MKKLTLLLFVFSQFVYAQSGEDANTIYIECDGDSIAVDISQFPNLSPEILFEMFDCSDVDDWFWGDDSTDVNNPWDDEDDDFWDFDSTNVNNPWDEEELAFDCINSSPEAFELYLSCMNEDEGACEALETLCGEEEEEEEWGDDIDALIEQLENDCASQVDSGWSCGILEMINDCMSGNEEACEELEVLYEDFEEEDEEEEEEEDEEEEWGDDIDALIEQLENDCASQVDLGWSCEILEMINDCMSGNEEACEELELLYEDFEEEEVEDDEEEFDCINSSPEAFELYFSCMNGDEAACEALEMLCGGEEEAWSWGEDENMSDLFNAISSITVTENELVLVLEANDLIVSIFDGSGFEYSPLVVDGYLVFGPFDINQFYNIIIENMDGLEVLWGLFKPIASDIELIEEGIVSAIDNNFGDMFYLNQMISIDEVHQDLKAYNTQYYNVMGRKVSKPSQGFFIEVQTTNIGEISTKRFILK